MSDTSLTDPRLITDWSLTDHSLIPDWPAYIPMCAYANCPYEITEFTSFTFQMAFARLMSADRKFKCIHLWKMPFASCDAGMKWIEKIISQNVHKFIVHSDIISGGHGRLVKSLSSYGFPGLFIAVQPMGRSTTLSCSTTPMWERSAPQDGRIEAKPI